MVNSGPVVREKPRLWLRGGAEGLVQQAEGVAFRTKAIRGEAIGSHQKRKAPAKRGKHILVPETGSH